MAIITAFRGLRYNKDKFDNLAQVVTLPYDLIDETAQAKYYALNSANIIRLELGLALPQDTPGNNCYTRASQYLKKWIEGQTLIPDKRPSIYFYQQEFQVHNQQVVRNGMLCGLMLEPHDNSIIISYEQSLSKIKADRLSLLRATGSNFSPILGLFADQERYLKTTIDEQVKTRPPDVNLVDENNVIHRLWVIEDETVIAHTVDFMRNKKIYIAEGHHRYESALEYFREMTEQGHDNYNYIMANLVNLYDEGMFTYPAHMLVGNLADFNYNTFLEQLMESFVVEIVDTQNDLSDFMQELARRDTNGQHVFGMYANNKLHFLELKETNKKIPSIKSADLNIPDATILYDLVMRKILGISEHRHQEHIAYSPTEEYITDQVRKKQFQLGFLLNPPQIEELVEVSNSENPITPLRLAYLYPPLLAGLVINNLNIK
ncbi:MAG: DUF1015 domain-containing protein [Syntrophomonadaceae bacterium]|nr:DUF1015 domain-containing protein [Syntrophomonadaceae bacterium]MDD3888957.1 DUF1015 domain-containing protein [Syntrophomonadaceae bacterium]MDD4548685.1 DUF1015 domain-containing protein [Syntrophomonadaceae bacterium]